MSESRYLIVGSDGQIGSALLAHFQRIGIPVIGTTRRSERIDSSHLYLDLRSDMSAWRPPGRIGAAVVAAAVTKLDVCESDPAATRKANVLGTVELVRQLVRCGTYVIFLSTNLVFDGSVPFVPPDHPHSPVTEYGRQKAEVEQTISLLGKSVAIVRFTKILGPHHPLFDSWTQALRQGEAVHPFSDLNFSPVPLFFAVSVISKVIAMRAQGIVQASGEKDVSYAHAAQLAVRMLGVDVGLVQPVCAAGSGHYSGPLPHYTTLDTSRLRSALGLEPPEVDWTISRAFRDSWVLGMTRE